MTTTYVAHPIAASIRRLATAAAGRNAPVLADDEMLALAKSALGIPVLWTAMLGAFGYGFHGGPLLAGVVNTVASILFIGIYQSLTVPLMVLPLRGLRALGFDDANGLMEAGLVLSAAGGIVMSNVVFAYPFSREALLAIGAASIIYGFGLSISRYAKLRPDAPRLAQVVGLAAPFMPGPLWFLATSIAIGVVDLFDLGQRVFTLTTAMLT